MARWSRHSGCRRPLKESGWRYLDSDAEIRTLSILKPEEPVNLAKFEHGLEARCFQLALDEIVRMLADDPGLTVPGLLAGLTERRDRRPTPNARPRERRQPTVEARYLGPCKRCGQHVIATGSSPDVVTLHEAADGSGEYYTGSRAASWTEEGGHDESLDHRWRAEVEPSDADKAARKEYLRQRRAGRA